MEPGKKKPTVKILRPGRNKGVQTVARLTKEELEKYANDRPLFRPPPRGKKSA